MPGFIIETLPPTASLYPAPATVIAAEEGEVLLTILRPEVNLALWQRPIPGDFTSMLAALMAHAPFCAEAEGIVAEATDALAARLPAPAPLDLLLDIRRLAVAFSVLTESEGRARLRLEAITGPGCSRWHADAVGLRMLCTYRGAGTQWLCREGGAALARTLPEGPQRAAAQIAPGTVAVLKGEGFPGNAGHGCIHRSPPGGTGGQARLLLCIDEPGRIPLS
jgi:hypothetical protein